MSEKCFGWCGHLAGRLCLVSVVTGLMHMALAAPGRAQEEAGTPAFQRGDYEVAYEAWLPFAEQGDAMAQYNMGLLYRDGLGVDKDPEQALQWFMRAGAQGDPVAQVEVGDLYAGVALGLADYKSAAEWYRQAAEQGDAVAQRKLGELYQRGRGVDKDEELAAYWLGEPQLAETETTEVAAAEPATNPDGAERTGDEEDDVPFEQQPADNADEAPSVADDPPADEEEVDVAILAEGGFDQECPWSAAADYDINVNIDIAKARLHHDRSIADLGQMAFHGGKGRILGLANATPNIQWKIKFSSKKHKKSYCFWIDRVDMTLSYPTPDLYVAREYRPGSCQYNAVLEHEKDHYRTTRRVLQQFAPRFRSALISQTIPTGMRPVVVDSPDDAKLKARAIMRRHATPLIADLKKSLRRAQGELDSPMGYREVFNQCRSW